MRQHSGLSGPSEQGEAGTTSLPLVGRDEGGGVQLILLSSPFTLVASVLWSKVSPRPLAELSLCHTSSLCPSVPLSKTTCLSFLI